LRSFSSQSFQKHEKITVGANEQSKLSERVSNLEIKFAEKEEKEEKQDKEFGTLFKIGFYTSCASLGWILGYEYYEHYNEKYKE
jgi:hypothetical protein